ncbi:hypothetical protein [Enterococcus hulanensis]|uniref:hypothetical protein n=1 Tax=Enterococcus hulanensis TaxID=2559929 RepID=UPI001F5C299A|nr:hypothetical protein [Enterococcus hulanensis]
MIAATTAASSDTAIVTVVNNGTGFDAVIAGEGSATINFTSGSLAASITVTGQAAG